MSALTFIITDAGRAACANAGTIGPVVLQKVAVGSSGYVATASQTALQTQIKQITPQGSSVPTPGTIHITFADSSADAYDVKEIGLITSDGTLFAVYAQTDNIIVKSSGSVMMLAIDFLVTGVPPDSVTIGDANFQYPPATETVKGVSEIATQAETNAGLDDERMITPLKLKVRLDALFGNIDLTGFATKTYVDSQDSTKVAKAGDTMTGFLVLSANPVLNMHAVTKQYLDAAVSGKVAKAGDTMTGFLTLHADPTADLHCVPKRYLDAAIAALQTSLANLSNSVGGYSMITKPSGSTFTLPAGKTSFRIRMVGGGGGGGAYFGGGGGGGGGGGYIEHIFTGQTPGTVYSIGVGSGGAAVNSGNGGDGGQTYIIVGGVTYYAGGGSGGNGGSGAHEGGAGGSYYAGAMVKRAGGTGGNGSSTSASGGGGAAYIAGYDGGNGGAGSGSSGNYSSAGTAGSITVEY